MKLAVVIKGKLIFMEGSVNECCQTVEQLGLTEFQISFIMPQPEPTCIFDAFELMKSFIPTGHQS